jgi:hypothetical protein
VRAWAGREKENGLGMKEHEGFRFIRISSTS